MHLASIRSGLTLALWSLLAVASNAIDTYDVIVIGSGPGGLVAAEFLSRDPSLSVLVLEAGLPSLQATGGTDVVPPYATSKGYTAFDIPGEYGGPRSIFNDALAKYRIDWLGESSSLGKLVGGCSSINAALYFRTPRSYVDSTRWPFSADRVSAGFDAIETMFKYTDLPSPDGKRYTQEAYDIASAAFKNFAGYKEVDVNGPARDNKDKTYGHAPFTFKNGLRDSPAKTFYTAFKNRPNTKLLTSATVSYIKHINGRATGVVYNGNIEVALSARGAVVMGAGATGTPKVLIQSGIGPLQQLNMLNNRADFPGISQTNQGGWVINENVGKSLFDTNVVFASFSHPQMKVLQNPQSTLWVTDLYMNQGQSGPLASSGPLLIGYENTAVAGRTYEFQTTIIGSGFGEFSSRNDAFFAALYVNNPVSRDRSEFNSAGQYRGFSQGTIVMSAPQDVAAMKYYANKVVNTMKSQGATFISAKAGESVDAWVDRNKFYKTQHYGGTCYTSSDANDSKRCADTTLKVIGTTNIFIADGSAMKEGTVNPFGFIMYTGYEAHNMVKAYIASAPPSKECSVEPDVDYIGNDIGNALSSSASGCCQICQNRAGCQAYTWSNYNGGTCWLKSSKGASKITAGVSSGVVGGVTPPSSCSVIEEGVDYVGNDIDSALSQTAEGCCAICKARAGCGAFSWNNYNGGTCWLKSSKGAVTAKAGTRSSFITSPSMCPTLELNTNYVNNDIGNKLSPNAEGCCSICKSFTGCKAYSWSNYNGGTCWLKSGKAATEFSAGTQSGVLPTRL